MISLRVRALGMHCPRERALHETREVHVIQHRFLLCFLGFGTLIACSGSGATVVDPGNQDPPVNVLQPGAVNEDPPTNSQRPPTNNQGSSSSSVGSSSGPVRGGQGGSGNQGTGGRQGGDSGGGNVAGSGTGTACTTTDFCQGCDVATDCLGACNCINQVAGTAENCATDCAAQ
jgi:hypothetical protein